MVETFQNEDEFGLMKVTVIAMIYNDNDCDGWGDDDDGDWDKENGGDGDTNMFGLVYTDPS